MDRTNPNGMYISKEALREQFDPRMNPPETYLLCELQWGNSARSWIHWVRNDSDTDCHAEKYFLEEIFELRSFNSCDITWYLSWSPCASCCYRIRDFLERHPNVNIDIHVARIYTAYYASTRRGLRALASSEGVTIDVMEIEDYRYCWETFLQRSVYFLPVYFLPAIIGNRSQLDNILEVEKGNSIMKEKLRVQFSSFGFQHGKFVDFYLELQSQKPSTRFVFNLDQSMGFSSSNGATQPLSALF